MPTTYIKNNGYTQCPPYYPNYVTKYINNKPTSICTKENININNITYDSFNDYASDNSYTCPYSCTNSASNWCVNTGTNEPCKPISKIPIIAHMDTHCVSDCDCYSNHTCTNGKCISNDNEYTLIDNKCPVSYTDNYIYNLYKNNNKNNVKNIYKLNYDSPNKNTCAYKCTTDDNCNGYIYKFNPTTSIDCNNGKCYPNNECYHFTKSANVCTMSGYTVNKKVIISDGMKLKKLSDIIPNMTQAATQA